MPEGNKPQATLGKLMKYLGTPERPVTASEFGAFWKSCSEEEKEEFRKFAATL